MLNLHQVKEEICDMGRRLYNKGFAAANDGNISYRIDENRVVCTPTQICKGFMKPEDLCIVDMDGAEPPICDGSSREFSAMVERAGVVEQNAEAKIWTPTKPLHYKNGSTQVAIFPDIEKLSVSCVTSFKGCPFDPQYFEYELDRDTYKNEIAPGRTFVDYRDLRALMSYGLCKGGTLDAAAIICDGAVICKDELRFNNEIVRHKILDLLGDIYLCGVRIKGNVIAVKPGHPANVALTKMIIDDMNNN